MHRRRILPPVRPVAYAVSLALAITACAGGERERGYATPGHLCGTPIRPSLLDPFLPGGKQIDVSQAKSKVIGLRRCAVAVDGERVLSLATEWRSPETGISEVSASGWRIDVSKHVSEDGSHSYSAEGGVSKVSCPHPARDWRSVKGQLFAVVYTSKLVPENEQPMKELVTNYAKATGESSACNSPASTPASDS